MTSRFPPGAPGKAAVLALSVLLAAGGTGRGQAAATQTTATQTTTPGEIRLDPPAAPSSPAPKAEPAVALPSAPAPEVKAEAARELYGPQKPAAHQAIRAALIRAAQQQPPAEQRAILRAVDAFYAEHGDAPIFFDQGQWTAQARGVFTRLQKAPEDGLDLRAWKIYSLDPAPEAALAIGEVALAQAVAAYALQASGGRLDPHALSKSIGVRPPVVGAAQALAETAGAADADRQLASYNPAHPGYLALREKLAELRANPASNLLADAASKSGNGRRASDARGSPTAPPRGPALEAALLANMEFWRWLPRDLGADRIMVNIPEFMARLYRGETVAAANRIVVGKPDTPTPLFSDKMEYVIVNPSWYVPQSIIRKEMMGKLDALRAQGYEIVYQGGQVHVRQPPGERNALGRIKFIFPNDYAVYMHDTPTRKLFAQSRRAFSHGCMRVDQPLDWAVAILGAQNGWSAQRIEKMYGKSERRIALPAPLPIHIGYFTLAVDETGALRRFEDLYGYEAGLRRALGLGG